MTDEELNKIAALEQAIAKKYGSETIQNPRSTWTAEKEQEYLKSLKTLSRSEEKKEESENVEADGYLISKKVLERKSTRHCPKCNTYSFDSADDVYMARFKCCFKCYILFIEGR